VCRKIFLGSLALAMKDRETGKGKEGRGGGERGGESGGEREGREGGGGREGMEMGGSLLHGSWGDGRP
jgi:hypothetical protein